MMIDSLNGLPLKVMNLASEDLHLWKELAAAKPQTKIISTNLVPKDPSIPPPAPFAIVEIPGQSLGIKRNVKIGFFGLANPASIKPKSDFTAIDPVEAIDKAKAKVANQADFLVVLGDVPKSVAIRVANAHPEVLAFLMTEKSYMRHNPEQVNNAVLLWSIEKGRNLGRLDLELNDSGQVTTFKPSEVVLDATVPEDGALLKRQKEIAAQVPASATH